MRLAFFIHNMALGGAQRSMMTLAKAVAGRGLDVDLVLVRAAGPYLSERPERVRLVDLGASRIMTSLPGLVRYLRRERPAALLSFLSPVNCVAIWARMLGARSTRLVISERSTFGPAQGSFTDRRILPTLMRWTYPNADGVIAISNGVAEDLARLVKLDRDRISVVYNPALRREVIADAAEHLDHPWHAPGAPPVILGVGRLTLAKDFPTLLRAFAMVRAQRPARLVIVGEGEERQNLQDLAKTLGIEHDMRLTGFEANPYRYMSRSAVFVLSSQWEGFGNVLVEAMALGTPVVSTNCQSGPAEILEDGRWGKLVPVKDHRALAAAILQTLAQPGPDARKRAEDFSVDQIVEKYLALLIPAGLPPRPRTETTRSDPRP